MIVLQYSTAWRDVSVWFIGVCFFFLFQSRPQGAPVQQLFLSCLLHSRAYILPIRPVGVVVVGVFVKRPELPPCAIDGRSRNPLYFTIIIIINLLLLFFPARTSGSPSAGTVRRWTSRHRLRRCRSPHHHHHHHHHYHHSYHQPATGNLHGSSQHLM